MRLVVSSLPKVAFFFEDSIISHSSLIISLYVGCALRTLPLQARNSFFLLPSSFFLWQPKIGNEGFSQTASKLINLSPDLNVRFVSFHGNNCRFVSDSETRNYQICRLQTSNISLFLRPRTVTGHNPIAAHQYIIITCYSRQQILIAARGKMRHRPRQPNRAAVDYFCLPKSRNASG